MHTKYAQEGVIADSLLYFTHTHTQTAAQLLQDVCECVRAIERERDEALREKENALMEVLHTHTHTHTRKHRDTSTLTFCYFSYAHITHTHTGFFNGQNACCCV